MSGVIAWREWNGQRHYVSDLPGQGGVDWGYTVYPQKALKLSKYWARRFNAYSKACGDTANFIKGTA